MAHYTINVSSARYPIPFPKNPQIGDTASVYFPVRKGNQLIQRYTFDGRTWRYTGYTNINVSS